MSTEELLTEDSEETASAEETDNARFGARVRNLRRARGLTQQQLASSLKISQPLVSLIEQGRNRVGRDSDLFAKLASVLGVDEQDLVG
jgi:transcriptional regulator with XRE-family HTH domain